MNLIFLLIKKYNDNLELKNITEKSIGLAKYNLLNGNIN